MIFGWLEDGTTDRWVMVDAIMPWPALHNGRNAMRAWAEAQNAQRALDHTAGPRRCPWPCKVPVKEDGSVELRIWPCEPYGIPRRWTEQDNVWRDAIAGLAETVASGIKAPVDILWMGGETIERATQAPGLRGMGFLCWGKGEREPTAARIRALKDLRASAAGADMGIRVTTERDWH
jgi:hypothetical protein